jgi:hypothetical protein
VPLDADIQMAADLFPFYAFKPSIDFMRRIYGNLPIESDAARLCQVFENRCRLYVTLSSLTLHLIRFLNTSIYNPLPPSSFVDSLIEELYRPPPSHELDLHRLGLFYMIIATATLHDHAKAIYNDESFKYFNLARACLSSKCILENPTVPALQALVSALSFRPLSALIDEYVVAAFDGTFRLDG